VYAQIQITEVVLICLTLLSFTVKLGLNVKIIAIIKIGESFLTSPRSEKIRVKNRKINSERELTGSKLNLYHSEMMIHSTFFLSMPWLKGHSEY
jgi:hypothetical protein